MKLWKMITVCVLAGSFCLAAAAAGARAEQQSISEKVIRLHVLAASDSAEDQSAKLLVRDAVLEALSREDWQDRRQAEEKLRELLPGLCDVGEEVLANNGTPAPVTGELGMESYPTRHYGAYSLPAGDYLSLRLAIGPGEGKNWWCVVYPSFCLGASPDAAAASAGFTAGEMALITEDTLQIRVKFRILEILRRFSVGRKK